MISKQLLSKQAIGEDTKGMLTDEIAKNICKPEAS